VLLGALVASAASLFLFAAAGSFLVLFIARTAAGMAAANISITQAYVADTTPPLERARGLGFLGAAMGLGFVLGPGLGGLLALFGHVAVPLGAAALALVNFALVAARLPESLPPEARHRGEGSWFPLVGLRYQQRSVGAMLAVFFVVIFAFSTMEATLALYCEARFGFGVVETSVLLVMIGVVLAGVQGLFIGRLVPRYGERRLVVAGIFLMALGLLALPLAPVVALLAGACALMAIGAGIHQPSLLGLLSQMSREASQGETLGLSRSMQALARTVGPLWGGWAFKSLGPEWPFWSGGAIMALALLAALFLLRRPRAALEPAA
jgi:MFS transporter, DHA1 family, tetracycline resistance protein